MSITGASSIVSLSIQRIVALNRAQLARRLQDLATGDRTFTAPESPSDLVAAQFLAADLAELNADALAAERSSFVASTVETSLAGISDMLGEARSLALANADSSDYSRGT